MRRTPTWFALIAILALVTSACASGKDTGFPPIPTETAHDEASCEDVTDDVVDYEDPIELPPGNCYVPKHVRVKAGTAVDWVQTDEVPHTVTVDGLFDSHPDCPSNTSACMQDGDTYQYTPTKAGKITYYCKLHGTATGQGMAGTIEVTA